MRLDDWYEARATQRCCWWARMLASYSWVLLVSVDAVLEVPRP